MLASLLSLLFVRPRLAKAIHGKRRERLSNADALMGRIGRVSEAIERGGYGRVAIDGDDWKAVSADGEYIPLGQNVRVVGRESIIITVTPTSVLPMGGSQDTVNGSKECQPLFVRSDNQLNIFHFLATLIRLSPLGMGGLGVD